MNGFNELAIVGVTCMATGSFLTLLTCWGCGLFDGRSETADIDAFTAGVQRALNVQRDAFDEAEYTEHSPQIGAQ